MISRRETSTTHALQAQGSLIRDRRLTANWEIAGICRLDWLGFDLSDEAPYDHRF